MTTKGGEKENSSSILSILGFMMVRSDAWNKKTGAHASTLEMELMHEAEKQGAMHHFSSDGGRARAGAAGTNREIDARTLKNDVPASIGSLPPSN